MQGQAEALRAKALECERRAVLATQDAIRAMYQELAHQWRDMAEQVEELERQRAVAAEAPRQPPIATHDF